MGKKHGKIATNAAWENSSLNFCLLNRGQIPDPIFSAGSSLEPLMTWPCLVTSLFLLILTDTYDGSTSWGKHCRTLYFLVITSIPKFLKISFKSLSFWPIQSLCVFLGCKLIFLQNVGHEIKETISISDYYIYWLIDQILTSGNISAGFKNNITKIEWRRTQWSRLFYQRQFVPGAEPMHLHLISRHFLLLFWKPHREHLLK